MPILPLDHPEPFAATLGVMLYPGLDEDSQRKARAFAAQYLAEPLRQLYGSGGTLSHEHLVRIAFDAGTPLDDIPDRWRDGLATGQIHMTFYALANANPDLASWRSATKLVEINARSHQASASRSTLSDMRSRYQSVAHLWGAWVIRDGKFTTDLETGYDAWIDFQCFLAEAEFLRLGIKSWLQRNSRSERALRTEAWRVPDDWQAPIRQPGWPQSGGLPDLKIPDEQLAHLRPAGRPRKKPKKKR